MTWTWLQRGNLKRESESLCSVKDKTLDYLIYRESYGRLKFDHTEKLYRNKLESILENEMDKNHCESKIQNPQTNHPIHKRITQSTSDHPIKLKRPVLVFITKNKRTCYPVDFAVPADHAMKIKESKPLDKN